MAVSVRIELNQRQINAILRSPRGIVARNMQWRGNRVRKRAQRLAPSRSGRLRNSITVSFKPHDGAFGVRVGSSLFYAGYVHFGTGIYGPTGQPITARNGGYLKFTGRDGSIVLTRSVRGQPPNPFLARAMSAAL